MKARRKKASPCESCGACPTCGRAPASASAPMLPLIILQPAAPRLIDGPIWIAPEYLQWNPGWNTAGANPYSGTFVVTNTTTTVCAAPGAADIGNGYRPIWGRGGVS